MAELSQIEKDNVVYDLKDAFARSETSKRMIRPSKANVGDVVRVLNVVDGIPTEYEAYPMQEGDNWELIVDHTVEENCSSVSIETDMNGKPFTLRKALVVAFHRPYVEDDGTVNGVPYNVSFADLDALIKVSAEEKCISGMSTIEQLCHFYPICSTGDTLTTAEQLSIGIRVVEKIGGLLYETYNGKSANTSSIPHNIVAGNAFNSPIGCAFTGRSEAYDYTKHPKTAAVLDTMCRVHIGGIYNSVGKGSRIIVYGVRE